LASIKKIGIISPPSAAAGGARRELSHQIFKNILDGCLSWIKSEPISRKILTLTFDCPACLRQAGQKSALRIPTHGSESPPSAGQARKNSYLSAGRQKFFKKELFLRA